MTPGNVHLARQGFEMFNRRDVDGFLQLFHPDAEARNLEGDIDDRVYRGHDGIREYVGRWFELFDEVRAEPQEFLEVGDCVVVPFRLSGVARGSGLPVDLTATYVFEVRDGRATRWTPYRDKEAALRAVHERSPADRAR